MVNEAEWRAIHTQQIATILDKLDEVIEITNGVIATRLMWDLENVRALVAQTGGKLMSPLPYHTPTVIGSTPPLTVQVSIPNEDPDTEDDLTIQVALTGEGIIVDLYVSDGEPVATFGQTYEEFVGTIHNLDPINQRSAVCTWPEGDCIHPTPDPIGNHMADRGHPDHRPADSPIQSVAALSADLRATFDGDSNDAEHDAAVALLDAIDAMLSEENEK